ncbi:hypothetical protein NQ317_019090 [Molorchus minor]|uniref:RNA (guanine-9-)-methyltransferase domain-containing protein 1 n=1 Tax=Molorchus minor TaxID=1323400 RepID=A0ABQ9JLY8_9CUCU|nr:hypothetical protein NQ317_019090 [Molorchus minor]
MFTACRNCIKRFKLGQEFSSNVVDSSSADENEAKEIDIEAITNGDKDQEHKLKVIMLEAEVMRQEGKLVPPISLITQEQWKELLNLPSRTARRKCFEFLFKVSKMKENRQFALKYDLAHNNILLRIYDTTINQFYNNKLIQAMMFGQKLVVDCGYDSDMTKRENSNCAKQLMLLFSENRLHADPFDLHLCNAHHDGIQMKYLHKFIPNMLEKSFPINVHEKSYLDIFPKDQLVYLTPHCREELTEYDHDAIYIIGAIVDKINNQPLSLAKAKKEGLKMAKLPLDRHLQWGSGSGKSLTLNQMICIMNDIKFTGNWKHALQHVPRRKLIDFQIGDHIKTATDNLRYDRPRRERKWAPASNTDLSRISYIEDNHDKVRVGKNVVKKIMND